ncbi:MAG TPA: hypothetical protein VL574_12345 [Stellaceae bacterium]|nr:hypothetical protein [Stellaceae bacterium]
MKRSRVALALLVSPWLHMAGHTMIGHAAAQSLQPGENLLAPIPDNFKPGGTIDDSGMNLSTFLPKKETTANWTQMITTQVYHGMPKYDPDKFAQILGTKWKKACKGGEAKKLSGSLDNGYPIAIWQFYCPLNSNTHKPESMWMKLIAGNDSLYNVHFSSRTKPSPATTKYALAYLQNVWACDTRNNGHPCQQANAAPSPSAGAPASATPAPATQSTNAPAAGSATTAKPSVAGQPPTAQPTTIPSTAPAQIVPPAKVPAATPAPSAPAAGAAVPSSPASKSPAPNSPAPKPAGQ